MKTNWFAFYWNAFLITGTVYLVQACNWSTATFIGTFMLLLPLTSKEEIQ